MNTILLNSINLFQEEDEYIINDEYPLTFSHVKAQMKAIARIDEQDASDFYFEQKARADLVKNY
ncbi:hypothetical protein KAT24_01795 [Candidatus Pacearchaeota archaeon]|nr:hypothetical protein [Candidatus Pacearchaeota archaeon]